MTPQTAWNNQNNITQDSLDTLFDLSLNYLLSNFIAEQIAIAVVYLSCGVMCDGQVPHLTREWGQGKATE